MSLASTSPPAPNSASERGADEICEQIARRARLEASILCARRFFTMVARARGRDRRRPQRQLWSELDAEAGAALAHELEAELDQAWARDGIDRGLELFAGCIDETGRRCVATLVAEYFAWREPPDRFFHRAGALLDRRGAGELVRLAIVAGAYARLARPGDDELRLLAAVPRRGGPLSGEGQLAVLSFAGDPPVEQQRITTDVPSLGSEVLVATLAAGEFGWAAEPGPATVPLVGRPLMWFPTDLDGDLRRLHLLFAAAIA